MYITFTSAKAENTETTLALKPRGDVTRKQGYQWPQKVHCPLKPFNKKPKGLKQIANLTELQYQ